MADGMVAFQTGRVPHESPGEVARGLPDQEALDRYCYHVAGVVGELLTELFCIHLPALEPQREQMMVLGRSFGQGLQMTNILKDLWDDLERGACWLPRSVFDEVGFDLRELRPGLKEAGFDRGLSELIGITHGHLANALDYTLRIPASEDGIRKFCLWTLGMAILTLRKIHRNRGYTAGSQVKISRHSVRAMAMLSGASARHAPVVRALFSLVGWGVPRTIVEVEGAI
jgi:farnesyl-diphosphate farnesyltransferase